MFMPLLVRYFFIYCQFFQQPPFAVLARVLPPINEKAMNNDS
jgi:hypothetical protein